MKIILAALNAKYVHSNLAVYNLEAYAKKQLCGDSFWRTQKNSKDFVFPERKEQPEIIVKEYTINHNLDMILQSIYQEKAAVVAFSCYIWNVHEILTISRELKKVLPDVHIWLGGPEVSYDALKRLEENEWIEGIMQGEGEVTFYELLKVWTGISGSSYRNVLGIVYRDRNKQICQNPARPLMELDAVPFIYTDLSKFENKILYYETSRGCPFSCSYCLSSIDKRVRFRSMELVKKELQFFLDNKVHQVKLIDRTFNCNKEHSLGIWRYILEHDNGVTNFHFEVAADLIGEEELAVFRQMRPGLIQLEIGLQSVNNQTIQEIRRVMNIDQLKKIMLAIRGFGNIHQHLDLIAGLPYEDFITFKESFNAAYEMKPNQLQLGFLKVLKGSYMEEQSEQYELKYQDFQPYEVLSTKWISYDEILGLKKVEEMVEVYYNSDQFEDVLSYLIPFFESPYAFYEVLGRYYEDRKLLGIGFKREARYEVLRQFCKECIDKCDNVGVGGEVISDDILDDLLLYDYYLRENAKSRPSWAKTEPIEKRIYQEFFKNGGTEEISLNREGYDSKAAARAMHIEPMSAGAVRCLLRNGKEILIKQINENDGEMYCLFDYENRNPLSKDAKVTILTHL
ncbi:MAG: DUF4080 domain-containing protein [Lachnospiraceae bacterium]|nr:DUF4080 domain-containing protein [Lachnospiraceae bacterium]